VAQALYDHESPNSALAWEHKPAHFQENVRRFADAAILALTPFIAASIRTPPTPATDEREAVAVALWVADAVRAAPNVARYRNAASFKEQDANHIELWLGQAGAALSALAPVRAAEILAAEANERARIVAWLRGYASVHWRDAADAIERNEHGAGK